MKLSKTVRGVFLSLLFLVACQSGQAQTNSGNSLLWRISGNGIAGHSYLYGTMHVRNSEAFHFKDSLYYFIENAKGFAMEVHPDSAGQLLQAILDGRVDLDEKMDFSDSYDDKEIEKILTQIERGKKTSGKNKKKASYLMQKLLEASEADEESKKDDMHTFMDAYLYGLALQNQKSIHGLEEVEDQIRAFKYLVKGIKMKSISEMLDKGVVNFGSRLNKYYYKEEIDSIRYYYKLFFSDSSLKGFLYDRNIVMARQMDSLAKVQTMVFAVGVGHLPGEEGVIALLRNKGYTVEPVQSSKKIFAGDYKQKKIPGNWKTYTSNSLGFAFQMPGKITSQQGIQGREVSYCYNLAQGMVYMVIAGKLSALEKLKDKDSVFTSHTESILEGIGAWEESRKPAELEGLKGYEIMASSFKDGHSRMVEVFDGRNFYLLMITSEKKERLTGEDAASFFASFASVPVKPVDWKKNEFKTEGFSVDLPGIVKPVKEEKEEGDDMSVTTYTGYDGASGANYSVVFSKPDPGVQMGSGAWLFNTYVQNIRTAMNDVDAEERDTLIGGYPARWFVTEANEGTIAEGFILQRNNLNYAVIAEYDNSEVKRNDLDRFFRSFRLSPFAEASWKISTAPSNLFSVWAPGNIMKQQQDTSSYMYSADKASYYASDENSADNYTVEAEPLNTYYWAANIDSVYADWKAKKVSYTDSIISQGKTTNGGLSSFDVVTANSYSKLTTRHRFILNGNTMYSLEAAMPDSAAGTTNFNRFFESFKLGNEESSAGVFAGGPDKLFQDLLSTDSTTFTNAYNYADAAPFTVAHFPLIKEKALLEYPTNEHTYQTVNAKLLNTLSDLAKGSAPKELEIVDYVALHYKENKKPVIDHRFHLLGMLASIKTSSSYKLINELFQAEPPSGMWGYTFFYKLYDSLSLTRPLYPAAFRYLNDSSINMPSISLASVLIDSNHLSKNELVPYQAALIALGKEKLKRILKLDATDLDYDYEITDLLKFLGYLNTRPANELLQSYLKVKVINIRFEAMAALIRNNHPVSGGDIKKLAGENAGRLKLYEALVKAGKVSQFPSEFANQQSMARSYIHQAVADYEEDYVPVVDLVFIKKIEIAYKGETKCFYLFRMIAHAGEEEGDEPDAPVAESYLSIAGPFDPDTKKLLVDEKENISGVYYDKSFDGMKADEFFAKYISLFLKAPADNE